MTNILLPKLNNECKWQENESKYLPELTAWHTVAKKVRHMNGM